MVNPPLIHFRETQVLRVILAWLASEVKLVRVALMVLLVPMVQL